MWRADLLPRERHIAADGLGFLAETPGSVDTVSWLWSMNYALLQHYERYDSESGTVQLRDWTAADQLCRERLRAAIDAHRKADVFTISSTATRQSRYSSQAYGPVSRSSPSTIAATPGVLVEEPIFGP
jgi:hypothetical protein